MIDKEKILEKFDNLTHEQFLKILDESIRQFPRKMATLMTHADNGNTTETSYFSLQIRESFAYIFHDSYLNFLCHKIDEASVNKDYSKMAEIASNLKDYSEKFLQQLNELKLFFLSNHQ